MRGSENSPAGSRLVTSGGALSPGPALPPREESGGQGRGQLCGWCLLGEDAEGAFRATSCSSHQPVQTPALTSGRPPGLGSRLVPRCCRGYGGKAGEAGRCGVARRLRGDRAGRAWPRRGLLQWHQVSPGAAGAQAHLQGHLWAAAGVSAGLASLPPLPRPPPGDGHRAGQPRPTRPQQHGHGYTATRIPGTRLALTPRAEHSPLAKSAT